MTDVIEGTATVVETERENLVDWVSNDLSEAGHPEPKRWENRLVETGTIALTDEYNGSTFQIAAINSALRYALLSAPMPTTEVRMMVVDADESDVDSWKNLIHNHVVPFMVEHNLS